MADRHLSNVHSGVCSNMRKTLRRMMISAWISALRLCNLILFTCVGMIFTEQLPIAITTYNLPQGIQQLQLCIVYESVCTCICVCVIYSFVDQE